MMRQWAGAAAVLLALPLGATAQPDGGTAAFRTSPLDPQARAVVA